MRYTRFISGTSPILLLIASLAVANEPSKPNIVLIYADDLGYGDVACYNDRAKMPTPHLDRLAREGMRFTDAHSPCTVCTPSRYGLLTGQMPFRVPGGGRVFTGAGGPSLIAPDKLTMADMLRDAGYATACFGKWHLGLTFFDKDGQPIHRDGLEAVQRIDYSRKIEGGPLDCGFDEFFGTACCPTTDWLYAFIDGDSIPVPPTQRLDRGPLPKHPYANDNRPGMIAPDFDLEKVDLKFLAKSRDFMRRHVKATPQRPFFLYHAMQAVHLPSFPADEFKGKTKAGPHGDFIFELDHVVGELMTELESLGIADNTLVIFSSDNGPEVPTVYHMRTDHNHDGAHPWRGMKRDVWEGGHRVPMIIRWPGRIAEGSTSEQMVSQTDLMATVAAILGHELPPNAAEDSFDLLPVLLGEELPLLPGDDPAVVSGKREKQIRPHLLMQGFGGSRTLAIRKGKWKYLDFKGSGGNRYENHRMLKDYYQPDTAPEAPGQLYDLEADPQETTNLYFEQPEVAKEMKALLDRLAERD